MPEFQSAGGGSIPSLQASRGQDVAFLQPLFLPLCVHVCVCVHACGDDGQMSRCHNVITLGLIFHPPRTLLTRSELLSVKHEDAHGPDWT